MLSSTARFGFLTENTTGCHNPSLRGLALGYPARTIEAFLPQISLDDSLNRRKGRTAAWGSVCDQNRMIMTERHVKEVHRGAHMGEALGGWRRKGQGDWLRGTIMSTSWDGATAVPGWVDSVATMTPGGVAYGTAH